MDHIVLETQLGFYRSELIPGSSHFLDGLGLVILDSLVANLAQLECLKSSDRG